MQHPLSIAAIAGEAEKPAAPLPLAVLLDAAHTAVASCSASGYHVTVTVLDPDMSKRIVLRADAGPDRTVEIGYHKAYPVIKTGLVVVLNHRGGTATLVNAKRPTGVESIKIGGELDFGVADGDGLVYVNVTSKHEIAVLDIPSGKVTSTIELSGCVEPSGLAYDAADKYLISVCDNRVVKIVRSSDKQDMDTLKTGKGSDGVIFDADRKLALVPAGEDGKLSVIGFDDHHSPKIVQTLTTQKGTRLGGLDPKTGRLYLPRAKMGPPVPPDPWPTTVPGSVQFMVVGPQ